MKNLNGKQGNFLVFALLAGTLVAPSGAQALEFTPVTLSCQDSRDLAIFHCGVRWSDEGRGAVLPMTESLLDELEGLDWKSNTAFQCEAKLGVWNPAGRQVFAIRNCKPE